MECPRVSTPTSKEKPDKSIIIFDYHKQTYSRNCWKNLGDRKKIIIKPFPLSLVVEYPLLGNNSFEARPII